MYYMLSMHTYFMYKLFTIVFIPRLQNPTTNQKSIPFFLSIKLSFSFSNTPSS